MQELCSSAVADPDEPVAQLNLITVPEVPQVLDTFNTWDLPYTELLNMEQQTRLALVATVKPSHVTVSTCTVSTCIPLQKAGCSTT